MHCLHCGGCCKAFSPKSAPFPCPYLVRKEGFYFCGIYERRHAICRGFYFDDMDVCPYGLNELHLSYPEDEKIIRERIEKGARLITEWQHKKSRG